MNWSHGTTELIIRARFFSSDGVNFSGSSYGFDTWNLDVKTGNGTLSFDYHYGYFCGYYYCQDWQIALDFAPGSFNGLPAKFPKLIGGTLTFRDSYHWFSEEANGRVVSVSSKVVQTPGLSSAYFTAVGVPEPASWAMIVAGFGAIGSVMRARRKTVVVLA